MDISRILIEVTGGQDPLCTIAEIGKVMRKQPDTIYAYRAGKTQPNWDDTVALSGYLIKEYSYYKLAMQSFPLPAESEGDLDDYLLDIMAASLQCMKADRCDIANSIGRMTLAFEKLKSKSSTL